ncbi:MAG TPA: hypothetical protein VFP20_02360 [Bacteroidales bacterium]|nr:hypothetical protein [Bacteroidales bacterium]
MKKTLFFLALTAILFIGCGKSAQKSEASAVDSTVVNDTTHAVIQEIDSASQVADEKVNAL